MNPHTRSAAFSLIEIVLAIGVISFALVGIIGLFPVALDSAKSSQQETHAALIARTIYNDLDSRPGPKTALVLSRSLEDPANTITVDLSAPGQYFMAFDAGGEVLPSRINAAAYASGSQIAGAVFLAKIDVFTSGLPDGLSRVEVTVSTPAAAPGKSRAKFPFTTLMRQE